MISVSQIVTIFKGFTFLDYVSIAIATVIGYYIWNAIQRHLKNFLSSYILCFIFILLSTIGLIVSFIYQIVSNGNVNLFILPIIGIAIVQTCYEGVDVYYCFHDENQNFEESLGIDIDGMFNFIDANGSTVPYKYLGAVSLNGKNYIVALDSEQKNKPEVFVSIFEVHSINTNKEFLCYNSVTDEDLANTIIKKFAETNPPGYKFIQ